MRLGIIIVDHGSKARESNQLVHDVAKAFAARFDDWCEMVEPAHMDLAEPTIAQAFTKCAKQGARLIIVTPLFLGPGKHWQTDIPRLVEEAAREYPHVSYSVASPLGDDERLVDLLGKRAVEAIRNRPLQERETGVS